MPFMAWLRSRDREDKCPTCDGSGDAPNGVMAGAHVPLCPSCKGIGVIDEDRFKGAKLRSNYPVRRGD